MSILCRLRLHRWQSTSLPVPEPGVEAGINTCRRPGCTAERRWQAIAPGWVRETICDGAPPLTCGDGEHPVHRPEQLRQIERQRAIRAAWRERQNQHTG